MHDEEKAKHFVNDLHKLGFKFALDDFGSGYTSFHYLKNLAVDYVKIDGEFIKNLETSPEDRYFVKALADLAKGLGVKIIAEFVENQSHVNILKEIGIDYLQGYHISKPIDNIDHALKNFDEKSIDEV
jgi:EAL domain-containing protein (putative c-di-GMP-specific phosphodiesterase class I)